MCYLLDAAMNKSYSLKKGCCGIELNITLCIKHFAQRIANGWALQRENGVDGLACYDCTNPEGKV